MGIFVWILWVYRENLGIVGELVVGLTHCFTEQSMSNKRCLRLMS